jgi:hypothetical protein
MYCSNDCRELHKKNKPTSTTTIPKSSLYKECYYCNDIATTVEHIVPKCIRMCGPTIPACMECNSLIGSYVGSLDEKSMYLKRQLNRKYAGVLKMPTWNEEALNEESIMSKEDIMRAVRLKENIIRRLLWIPDPSSLPASVREAV